jgi:hypothetical protein
MAKEKGTVKELELEVSVNLKDFEEKEMKLDPNTFQKMRLPLVHLFMQLQNSWRKRALSMRTPKGGERRTKIISNGLS